MEFHHGLWNGVSALYSENGRQLGEENARPLSLNHHVPAETLACKYAGSREGRLINISALRTAMQNFEPALAITQAVRRSYLSRLGPNHQVGLWDLNIMARASISLVAFQQRYVGQTAAPKTVSLALTSQYQFISGVYMICRHMMENADQRIADNQPLGARALFQYADERGVFLSFNGMACAGSEKKILEFLSFCNEGGDVAVDLSAIVSEPETWMRYALASIELDSFIETQRAENGAGEWPDASAAIQREFGAYVREIMGDEAPSAPGDQNFEVAALDRQNSILGLLGKKPIRTLPRDHIRARLA